MTTSKIRMLIVDDEPATRSLMAQIFTLQGHTVTCAEDGFSALASMRLNPPDILLSDLNMPGMSGFELLSVVRRRFPAMQVIAMSGAFSGDAIQPGVAADAFYEKASRLPLLLEIFASMARLEGPKLRPHTLPSPIWIQTTAHPHDPRVTVIIVCTECLRTFSHTLIPDHILIQRTECPHCDTELHYAVLAPTNSAFPQPCQTKTIAAIPLALLNRAAPL